MQKPNRIQHKYSSESFKEELEKLNNEHQEDCFEDPMRFFRQRHQLLSLEHEVI